MSDADDLVARPSAIDPSLHPRVAESAREFFDSSDLLFMASLQPVAALPGRSYSFDSPEGQEIRRRNGYSSASIVLGALAVELILKALISRQGEIPRSHHLSTLFEMLPQSTRSAAEAAYAVRHPGGRSVRRQLMEVLIENSSNFTDWRYSHERSRLQAALGETKQAFLALEQVYNDLVAQSR